MSKISKILIANRGEIAVRVIKTCKRLEIKTVAVFSDADRDSLFVRSADESFYIGASEVKESYLKIPKIIEACKATGADAVHPGYGFLSENPEFSSALSSNGIIFIGPNQKAMTLMADKIQSRLAMEKAGVPVVPGYNGEDQDPDSLLKKAEGIGFPVMIKATAGGGGKGMRRVENKSDFMEMLESAKREARNFFANDKVLLERYVESPRHIEFQVFGDSHGNVIHLFERECSIQRRHQKVIEESPAINMNSKLREKMGEIAVKAAKSIEYLGAGTVEFVLGEKGEFYFLEMNTRLQVEHPVTELITGLDLVEWQIRVAQKEELPFISNTQSNFPKQNGHAIEVRIYAEDPQNNFLPSIGRIEKVDFPSGEGVRVDTGVLSGSEISIYYDPMIAKLITHDATRESCIDKMQHALGDFVLFGLTTNIPYLREIIDHPEYRRGNITTHFIEKNMTSRNSMPSGGDLLFQCSALAAFVGGLKIKTGSVWDHLNEFLFWEGQKTIQSESDFEISEIQFVFTVQNREISVDLNRTENGIEAVSKEENIENVFLIPSVKSIQKEKIIFVTGDILIFLRYGVDIYIHYKGNSFRYRIKNRQIGSPEFTGNNIMSPMPGKILKVIVKNGEAVKAGSILLILEAMKMENVIKASKDATVKKLHCEEGSLVMQDQLLLEFD